MILRRPFLEPFRRFGQLPNQKVVVMRLELMRVHRQRKQIGNAIRAQPRLEHARVMDERIQHGEPAGAAALDHQFVRVSQAQSHHGLRTFHRILHV